MKEFMEVKSKKKARKETTLLKPYPMADRLVIFGLMSALVGNASRASSRFGACALEFVEDTIASGEVRAEDLCSAGSFSSSFLLYYRILQRSCEPLERPESIRLVFPHLIQHSNSYLSFLFSSLIGTLSTALND